MKKLFYSLWENKNLEVVLPMAPIISPKDGTQFLIRHKNINIPFWRINELKPIIECSSLALGVASMIIKDEFIPDFWVNIQWNAHRFFNEGINVFGRNPVSRTWGKPVSYPKKLSRFNYSKKYLLKLRRICNKHLSLWERSSKFFPPFFKNDKEFSFDAQAFSEAEYIFTRNQVPKKKKDVLWVNKKFILVAPRKPHLTGFHFQLFPSLSYWKKLGGFKSPWQLPEDFSLIQARSQIQGYFEMTVILFGVIKILLKEKNLNFYNPEIHFSGNWNKDLLPKEKGGKLSLDFLKEIQGKSQRIKERIIKKEKEKYLVGGYKEFRAIGHGHLYATFSPKEFVKLPSRPSDEVPSEWMRIHAINREKIKIIRQILQKDLTKELGY